MARKIKSSPRKRPLKEAPKHGAVDVGFIQESTAILLVVFAIFLSVSLYSYLVSSTVSEFGEWEALSSGRNIMGRVGMRLAESLIYLLGWCSFVCVAWALLLARKVWVSGWPSVSESAYSMLLIGLSSVAMAVSCSMLAAMFIGYEGGGVIGHRCISFLVGYVNRPGALLICLTALLLSIGFSTGVGTSPILLALKQFVFSLVEFVLYFCQLIFSNSWQFLLNSFQRFVKLIRSMYVFASSAQNYKERNRDGKFFDDSLGKLSLVTSANSHPEVENNSEEERFVLGEGSIGRETTEKPIISRRDEKIVHSAIKPLSKKLKKGKNTRQKEANDQKADVCHNYMHPSTEVLVSGDGGAALGPKDQDLIRNSKKLEQTLLNFRIGGRVTEVHPGPVITLYQFEPAAGVKVNRIVNLADDLALSLKVGSVRVYAPVPGKGTVGIEVPNEQREIVRLREVLESSEFANFPAPLGLALGKDTYGEPYVTSLSKMPHLLIAGATGTGKSVCINSLLMSLLFKNTPQDLRLILIDPKMLELSVYEEIPHLKAPVITIAKRARGVLWWAVQEMERRYRLMKVLGVRDISMFNRSLPTAQNKQTPKKKEKERLIELEEKDVIATGSPYEGLDRASGQQIEFPELEVNGDLEPLPRIVIVVDELADLMLTVGREIEELLTRLAQKARAAGIHLILATQRPSVNVITGLIKANFPARISFKVASKIDARTVMDFSGAEKLLGQGDMLFMSPGMGTAKRLHSPYVSDNEVHDVVAWIKAQGRPDYDPEIEKMIARMEQSESASGGGGDKTDEYDSVYDEAVSLVVEKGQASTSMVQRAFRIGYNRAARILETMEKEGIVGPADGAKARQVLVASHDDI